MVATLNEAMAKRIAEVEKLEDANLKEEIKTALVDASNALALALKNMNLVEVVPKLVVDTIETVDVDTAEQKPLDDDSKSIKEKRFNKNCFSSFVENLPYMKGTDKVEDWIFLIDEAVKRYCMADNEVVTMILMKLRGNALQLARKVIMDNGGQEVTWTKFKIKLRQTFNPGDIQMKLRSKLNGLKMSLCGNDFQKYLYKFQQIMNKIEDLPEKELIYHFLDGLPEKVKYDVIAHGASTLVDTITFANRYSECYTKASKAEVEQSNYVKTNYGSRRFPFRGNFVRGQKDTGNRFDKGRYRSQSGDGKRFGYKSEK